MVVDVFYNLFGEEVMVCCYCFIDMGVWNIEVDDYSYCLFVGIWGFLGDWDFDLVVLYLKVNMLDFVNWINIMLF